MTISDEKRKVLLTGASGFIGSYLIDTLLTSGYDVCNFDRKPPLNVRHKSLWVEGNLLSSQDVARALKDFSPDIVFNLAAHASISGGGELLRVNTEGLSVLIDAMTSMPTEPQLFHVSTQLAAGPSVNSFDPRDLHPYTAYGESKARSEEIVWSSNIKNWTILRPTNIWGPYHPTFAKAIWHYISKGFYLHPAGLDVVRSYGYVENVAHQMVKFADAPIERVNKKTFYVGDEPVPSTIWLDTFSLELRGKPVRRVPLIFLKTAALGGEISGFLGGPSPINLGRLHRMTSDFPVAMQPTFEITGPSPFSLAAGVNKTAVWLRDGAPAALTGE